MHVHFITIEIGVVGCCHRQVHPEGRKRKHFHSVAHYRHFVQAWLSVKQYKVAIIQVTFNDVTRLEMNVRPVMQLAEVNLSLVMTYDVLGSRPLFRTITN